MLLGGLCTQSRGRTGTGVNLLVFETSASTDSAIWACDASRRFSRTLFGNSEIDCKGTAFF